MRGKGINWVRTKNPCINLSTPITVLHFQFLQNPNSFGKKKKPSKGTILPQPQ